MIQWRYDPEFQCYCAENIPYCYRPKDEKKQALSLYVPAAYMNPNGTVNQDGSLTNHNGMVYTAKTVPVIYCNGVSGYRECEPPKLWERNIRYLKDGYVLVSAGARGRQTKDLSGKFIGKAPAALVDLKAGIRWLRAHKTELPGDMEKIVSVGTSAGGAMSSLLALTGNHPNYKPYLEEIGAYMEESDQVFAAQCYCPIINLEEADMAYEWMFQNKAICGLRPQNLPEVNHQFQRALSRDLAAQFPDYINGLNLGLLLGQDGRSGSYYNALMDEISCSLNEFLSRHGNTPEERQLLAAELDAGTGMISLGETEGTWKITDLDSYVMHYIGRMKTCPAFDFLNNRSPENQEFGCDTDEFAHFDSRAAELMKDGRYEGLDGYHPEIAKDYAKYLKDPALRQRIFLINPMNYTNLDGSADVAEHIRIRLGSADADTSFGIAFTLAKALQAAGHPDVDYALVWGRGHCDADYPGQFSAWLDRLMKKS